MENEEIPFTQPANEASGTATLEPAPTGQRPDHTMGTLCHLLSLTQLLGIPLGNILGPLTIWLLKKEQDPFADVCGKESLNFQISMTLYMIISGFLVLLLVGIFMLVGLMIVNITCTIIAAIKASKGSSYRYPLTIRFIK